MKRLLALIMAIVMCIAVMPAYASELPFSDVPKDAWYYNDVKIAYESELINGRNGKYYPDDNMTYAEAIKLAACMYQRYTDGAVTLSNGSPWYQSYVDFAKSKGIISKDYAWDQSATRAGYMEIFARALPESALPAINSVQDGSIPDVPMTHPQSWAIYKLYRAGILQGDTKHNCNPASSIKRREVAAILTRMMNTGERIEFTLGEAPEQPMPTEPTVQPLVIISHPQSAVIALGSAVEFSVTASGGKTPYKYTWQYKNNSVDWTDDGSSFDNTITKYLTAAQINAGIQYRCIITDALGNSVTSKSAIVASRESLSPTKPETPKEDPPKTPVVPETPTDNPPKVPVLPDEPIINIIENLSITSQPQDQTADVGESATFTVAVSGGLMPYTYKWKGTNNQIGTYVSIDGISSITGQNTASLTVKNVSVNEKLEGWKYQCTITDGQGNSVTTNAVKVNLKDAAPLVISSQPTNKVANVGDDVTFSVAVSGGREPYTYQWQMVFSPYSTYTNMGSMDSVFGEKGPNLYLYDVTKYEEDENRMYRCVITDAEGKQVISNSVKVNLLDDPSNAIKCESISPSGKATYKSGDKVTLTAKFTGGEKPHEALTWQYNDGTGWKDYDLSRLSSSATDDTATLSFTASKVYNGYRYRCECWAKNGSLIYSPEVTIFVS